MHPELKRALRHKTANFITVTARAGARAPGGRSVNAHVSGSYSTKIHASGDFSISIYVSEQLFRRSLCARRLLFWYSPTHF